MGTNTNRQQFLGVPCRTTHLLVTLLLMAATHFVTRYFDDLRVTLLNSCPKSIGDGSSSTVSHFDGSGWPERGYGSQLSLKIYVYDENEIEGLKSLMYGKEGTINVDICYKGQWGTQVKIHKLLLNSRFRTRMKEEADFFFVPTYVKCVHMLKGLSEEEINQAYVQVLHQMPYFRRSGGRDHIFVFPSGNGAHFFTSWKTFLNRSIFLTPEGDRTRNKNSSAFDTWKDIIIPGNVNDEMTAVEPLPLSKRNYLANYLGHAQGLEWRLQLVELAKRYPNKLEAPDLKLRHDDNMNVTVYFERLGDAKFCLIPRGLSSWTLRFFESFFVECVPVVLSDQIELPFQNVIDYTGMIIKWPITQIGPQLLNYLESIPDEAIENMIDRGKQIRCLWIYSPDWNPCSAMHGILWELQRKMRVFQQSSETFWLHNATIVNRNLQPFHNWKPPMPLP